ncbi:MAG: transcription-repair coupling factor [Thermoguttaceae bacterium]
MRSPFLTRLVESIRRSEAWQSLDTIVRDVSVRRVLCDGLWGSAATFVAAELASSVKKTCVLVVANGDDIEHAIDDIELLRSLAPHNVLPFPPLQSLESSLEERYTIGDEFFGQRIATLHALTTRAARTAKSKPKRAASSQQLSPPLIVTTLTALIQPVPTPQQWRESTRQLRTGETCDQEELVEWLLEGGWHMMPAVDLPGEVARRGHIVDLYAPDWERPVRIEFFGDEIESLRRFDIPTQRSCESLTEITLARLREGDSYNASLADYLGGDFVPFVVDFEAVVAAAEQYRPRVAASHNLHRSSDIVKWLATSSTAPLVTTSPIATPSLAIDDNAIVTTWRVGSVERLCGDRTSVERALTAFAGDASAPEVALVAPTDAEATRLAEIFSTIPFAQAGKLHTITGRLGAGFHSFGDDNNAGGMIIVGVAQLLAHREVRRVRRRHLGQVIDSFLDLQNGDLVVHLAHGIGRYRGLKAITKGRQEEDHLAVEFANEALVYVPVSKIAMVQKYVGGGKSPPPLAKLGGQTWQRQKKAVQEAVFDMAAEMLELQATRATREGVAFPEDSAWQTQFDAAFPYDETDDQIDAIAALKRDMLAPRPMDRLLCGDVGFGKTEVAIRGAFKAADAGYQVAVLVPTTVLAEQHFRTFSERFADFPITIAALSRFQSTKEQTQIVRDLADGKIDIVIGTHRITSKDVKFRNLGLLVIDEEQRFGVAVKERLKAMRSTVDVLTMTATPIPRTLHLSLVGIRDISNLESPPADRLAVETKLVRWDDDLIRSSILRELDRRGQIFFVHNRVSDIEDVADKLQRLAPEARIGVGHAQMGDGELESVMRSFVCGEFDMLVCTTIVESGLDIPTANTMFIDGADHYGLAELHQLRGRVGRGRHQAYCYLLLDANQSLTPVATKRLRAIEEFSYLGAGFQLAMRDLEIRGAGNILGTQQSGHIMIVGYELYCQLLESAVRVLKKMPQKLRIEIELDLPGRAILPKDYVENARMRVDLYRRLTRVTTMSEWRELQAEIQDRFGRPPREVERLLRHSEIRVKASRWTIRAIRLEESVAGDRAATRGGGYVVFDYTSRREMEQLQKEVRPFELRITDDGQAFLPLAPEIGGLAGDADAILAFIVDALTTYSVRENLAT